MLHRMWQGGPCTCGVKIQLQIRQRLVCFLSIDEVHIVLSIISFIVDCYHLSSCQHYKIFAFKSHVLNTGTIKISDIIQTYDMKQHCIKLKVLTILLIIHFFCLTIKFYLISLFIDGVPVRHKLILPEVIENYGQIDQNNSNKIQNITIQTYIIIKQRQITCSCKIIHQLNFLL